MMYRLGDVCSITKGLTGIMKAIPGQYPLVALSDERRYHNEYQFDAKAVIVPLISSTGHGHASMKRVHYQEGKFALGNILCAVIPNDGKKLIAKYLHIYLQHNKDSLLVPLMKGAANVSLPMSRLADAQIEILSIAKQKEIIALEETMSVSIKSLNASMALQEDNIDQLRQAFLKEAMQGKLVPQDPLDEPASELLTRIKAEKDKLIKAKKIPKGKELPPIKPEEIPYPLPANWTWCRLGDIVYSMTNGIYKEDKYYDDYGIGCFRMYNIKDGKINYTNLKRMQLTETELTTYCLEENDLLLNRVNSIELLGKAALIPNLSEPHVFESKNIRLRLFYKELTAAYVNYLFLTPNIKDQILKSFKKVTGQASISQERLLPLLIPLPPLSEQQRIVEKLNSLMQICDELKSSIEHSKDLNDRLLQSTLREALKPYNKKTVGGYYETKIN